MRFHTKWFARIVCTASRSGDRYKSSNTGLRQHPKDTLNSGCVNHYERTSLIKNTNLRAPNLRKTIGKDTKLRVPIVRETLIKSGDLHSRKKLSAWRPVGTKKPAKVCGVLRYGVWIISSSASVLTSWQPVAARYARSNGVRNC